MKYGEAFQKLGYALIAPRTDWSSQKEAGVCLTLWRNEIDWSTRPISIDSRLRGGRLEEWRRKPGNQRRRGHIQTALDSFDGWIDAIIVDGSSNGGVTNATPWSPAERSGLRWRIVDFESGTGHFKVCAFLSD